MTSPACPVLLAAQHIRELSDRNDEAERAASAAYRSNDVEAHRSLRNEGRRIYFGMVGVQQATAFMRAESPLGCILQLGLMADEGEHLYSLVPEGADEADAKRTRDAIQQMAYSVAAFIERAFNVRREDIRGEYFLPRAHDILAPTTP